MNRTNLLKTVLILIIFFTLIFCASSKVVSSEENLQTPQSLKENQSKQNELILLLDKPQWQETEVGSTISVKGKTNLPEEIEIWVFLKRKDFYVTGSHTLVKDGQFQTKLGPFNKEFYPGVYKVEVVFIPRRQKISILAGVPRSWAEGVTAQTKDLQIQKAETIKEVQKALCEKLDDIVKKTEQLYSELNTTYNKYKEIKEEKESFSKSDWEESLGSWQKKLEKLDELNRERNKGKVVALFPSLEKKLDNLLGSIRLLQALYLGRLLDKKEGMITIEESKPMIENDLFLLKGAFRIDYIPEQQESDTNNRSL